MVVLLGAINILYIYNGKTTVWLFECVCTTLHPWQQLFLGGPLTWYYCETARYIWTCVHVFLICVSCTTCIISIMYHSTCRIMCIFSIRTYMCCPQCSKNSCICVIVKTWKPPRDKPPGPQRSNYTWTHLWKSLDSFCLFSPVPFCLRMAWSW